MSKALKCNDELRIYAEKTGDRLLNLSHAASVVGAVRTIPTTDKCVGTDIDISWTKVDKPVGLKGVPPVYHIGGMDGNQRIRVKKKKNAKMKRRQTSIVPEDVAINRSTVRRRINCPQGAVISKGPGESTYADIAKKLKDGIDLEAIDVKVQSMKKNNEGSLFQCVRKDAKAEAAVRRFKEAAELALGDEDDIKKSSRSVLLEIRGISLEDGEEDIVSGICRYGATPCEVTAKRLSPAFGGGKRTVVALSSSLATKVVNGNRVLVRLVSYRVWLKDKPLSGAIVATGSTIKRQPTKEPIGASCACHVVEAVTFQEIVKILPTACCVQTWRSVPISNLVADPARHTERRDLKLNHVVSFIIVG